MSFRFPNTAEIKTYIQKSAKVQECMSLRGLPVREGFVMAPFDTRNGKRYLMLQPDLSFSVGLNSEDDEKRDKRHPGTSVTAAVHESSLEEQERNGADIAGEIHLGAEENHQIRELVHYDEILAVLSEYVSNRQVDWKQSRPHVSGHESYLSEVSEIRSNISRGFFQKAVLSRVTMIEGDYLDHISDIYIDICDKHPGAFVYVFKSNDHFWIGASPEPLMRISEGVVSTVSLAATRPFSAENLEPDNWTMKETLEQEYVTRYIHDILREFKVRDYSVTSPYVKKAGDLVHLRTDFKFNLDQVAVRLWDFLEALHPTPAVAGQPKEDAINFIKQLESHDREYYSGFLGPVCEDGNVDLFVNLRCMKLTPEYLALFVGGGITLESDPEDEWKETHLKAKALKNIVRSYSE